MNRNKQKLHTIIKLGQGQRRGTQNTSDAPRPRAVDQEYYSCTTRAAGEHYIAGRPGDLVVALECYYVLK